MIDNLKTLIYSKQFWLSVVAVLVLVLKTLFPMLPLTDDIVEKLFFLVITAIFGVTFNDIAVTMRMQSDTLMEYMHKDSILREAQYREPVQKVTVKKEK